MQAEDKTLFVPENAAPDGLSRKAKNVRTCIGCGAKRDKKELIRIVRTKTGSLKTDPQQKSEGRGAYLCRNTECLNRAVKRGAFSRSYRQSIGAETLNELKAELLQ